MVFFVNPSEGAEHSLKCAQSKIGQCFYFKIFSDPIVIKFGEMRLICINRILIIILESQIFDATRDAES